MSERLIVVVVYLREPNIFGTLHAVAGPVSLELERAMHLAHRASCTRATENYHAVAAAAGDSARTSRECVYVAQLYAATMVVIFVV